MSTLRWHRSGTDKRLLATLFGTRERSRESRSAISSLFDGAVDSVTVHGVTITAPGIFAIDQLLAARRKWWSWV